MKNKSKRGKAAFILLLVLAVFTAWTVRGNVTFEITHTETVSEKIPPQFSGFKIAHVSDLHNARFGKDNRRLIEALRREKPDIIAITGDLVDSQSTDIDGSVAFVRSAVKIAPCYYVTGNHDRWLKDEYFILEEKLLSLGVTVLHGESITLDRNGEQITLLGVDDPLFSQINAPRRESDDAVLAEISESSKFQILLAHRPERFEIYKKHGIDLALCGHTHGGQLRLPFIGGIIAPDQGFFPKYDAGIYKDGGTEMIISRGLGNSGVPLRVNDRPEIVIITLASHAS